MLSSVRAIGGYAAQLPALKGKTFTFNSGPGLTVLFGQNGSGKSTLLRLLATYSGSQRGGWSMFADNNFDGDKQPYPARFGKKEVEAEVTWDGTPTFYASGPPGRTQAAFEDALELGGEVADDYFRKLFAPGSSGQEQIHWFNKLEANLANPPEITLKRKWYVPGNGHIEYGSVNTLWQEKIKSFVDYVKKLPRKGPVSALLDEPDAHMSIPNQAKLWGSALPRAAKSHQIIVATHSPFALVAPNVTVIDLSTDGYVDQCRSALRAAFS